MQNIVCKFLTDGRMMNENRMLKWQMVKIYSSIYDSSLQKYDYSKLTRRKVIFQLYRKMYNPDYYLAQVAGTFFVCQTILKYFFSEQGMVLTNQPQPRTMDMNVCQGHYQVMTFTFRVRICTVHIFYIQVFVKFYKYVEKDFLNAQRDF